MAPLRATAAAYGIPAERVHTKEQCRAAVRRALATPGPYLIHVVLPSQAQVYPLVEPGTTPTDIIWRESAPGSGVRVYARDHFDYQTGRLREAPAEPTAAQPAPEAGSPNLGSF